MTRVSFERPACKIGPWLVSGNLNFRRVLTIPRTDNELHLLDLFEYTMFYVEHQGI